MGTGRVRQFYIDTALPAVLLGAVRERMSALRVDGHYDAVEREGMVVVVSAEGSLFAELAEAERAQQVLQRGAPDIFGRAAVAFVELGTGDLDTDDTPSRGVKVLPALDEPKTVVCAEDDKLFAAMVETVLKRMGIECAVAENGRAALTAIEDLEPDLVLLDLMMPDMHGWEVMEQMQTNDLIRDIPVIIITALGSEQDEVVARMVVGVRDYLVKPVTPDQLRRSVLEALGR